MELKSLSQLGCIEKEKEILKGLKLKLRTLSSSEQQEIQELLPITNIEQAVSPSLITKLQIHTLAKATVAVNEMAPTNKEELLKIYAELQTPVLNEAYKFYLELLGEQDKLVEELKKK